MRDSRIEALGFNIKVERMRKKISQIDLAARTNISTNSIISIEAGRQTPSCLVLYDIAKALDIPIAELYKGLE